MVRIHAHTAHRYFEGNSPNPCNIFRSLSSRMSWLRQSPTQKETMSENHCTVFKSICRGTHTRTMQVLVSSLLRCTVVNSRIRLTFHMYACHKLSFNHIHLGRECWIFFLKRSWLFSAWFSFLPHTHTVNDK